VVAVEWTSLEVAKLVVAALVPLSVVLLGLPVTRAVRRLEHAQWQSRKLIELRLEFYSEMARPLNDLLCFFRRIGDFQEITPPEALNRKRELDKAFFVNRHLMSEEFAERYRAFINACFRVYTGVGTSAQLRASRTQQRQERPVWDEAWDDLLIPKSETPTGLDELGRHYDALMLRFREEMGVAGDSAKRPNPRFLSRRRSLGRYRWGRHVRT
jgi:hypothetical protein